MSELTTGTIAARQIVPGEAHLAAGARRLLVARVDGLAPAEGANPTPLPGVEVNRVLRPRPRTPVISQPLRTRAWGEVVSLDLKVGAKTIFSFQIAARSAQLAPTTNLPWADVSLDSLPDLVASKVTALVERGAPRDFRDIYALCMAGIMTAAECWRLWAERQVKAKSDVDRYRARLAVETHLARIAQHHPLDAVGDPEQRAAAQRLRAWFRKEFLDALVD